MNPILLKPEADARSQIVVLGKPVATLAAKEYYRQKDALWAVVVESLSRLRAIHDVVVIEGAGSPAEVNIKDSDIVNMRVARHANAPVLLVGDIDRGGVFAALVGTLELLEPAERALVRGILINKFRGDVSLLQSGLSFLEERTGKPVLGVVPYFRDIRLADEDSVALEERARVRLGSDGTGVDRGNGSHVTNAAIDVAVVWLPHIANHDDFDPLETEEGIRVRYVTNAAELGDPDLVILPGTKTTIADLQWLHRVGLVARIHSAVAQGTPVIGICGGFQMLGEAVSDPQGVEGAPVAVPGLALLPAVTVFEPEKTTCQVKARVAAGVGILAGLDDVEVSGYEIHMGQTVSDGMAPAFRITERSGQSADASDGLIGRDGMVVGTYLHGLFESAPLRRSILGWLAARKNQVVCFRAESFSRTEQYDRLAAHVREHVDLPEIYRLMGIG